MKRLKNLFFSTFIATVIAWLMLLIINIFLMPLHLLILKEKPIATIDDGIDFPSRNIEKGVAQPWQKRFFIQ